jgi:signal peptidase I
MTESATETISTRRRPWVAALMTAGCPGLGHVYLGRPWRALAVAASFPAPLFALLTIGIFADRILATFFVGIAVTILFYVFWIIRAARSTGRLPDAYAPRWCNRVGVYFAAYVLLALIPAGMSSIFQHLALEGFVVRSASMLPTLRLGDDVWVEKLSSPRRGDIVTYERDISGAGRQKFLARLVGLEGDLISVRGTHLVVDGTLVQRDRMSAAQGESVTYLEHLAGRSYTTLEAGEPVEAGSGPFRVPAGSFFVLGDNRNNANDSRFVGALPVRDLIGRVACVYWPPSSVREPIEH